jgi:tetratricopeptide (TPR) repeat protein
MVIFILWLIFCFVAGFVGDSRKIGFWGAFLWSLFLSPLVGLIIAFVSDKKGQGQYVSPAMSKLLFEGDKLFKALDYDGAIEKYQSALKYSDKAPLTNFKLAKLYSIKKDGQNSFKHLVIAVNMGFKDFEKLYRDNDLTHLRGLQEFKDYVSNNYKVPPVTAETIRPLSKADELEKLTGLLEKGVLTKEEFENEKRKILS